MGHSCIKSAARMNSAVVIFLETVEKDDLIVERWVVIEEEYFQVFPLVNPARKVVLSNVPPFISDEIIERELKRHGQIVWTIKKIPLGCKSPLLKHVVSFRRQLHMILKNDTEELNIALKFRIEGFDYIIFATTETMKCFRCGNQGHLACSCPEQIASLQSDVQDRAQTSSASLQRDVQDRAQTSSASLQRDVQDRAQTSSASLQRDVQDRAQTSSASLQRDVQDRAQTSSASLQRDVQDRAQTSSASLQRDVQDRAQTSSASLQRDVQDRAQTSSASLQRDVQDRAQTSSASLQRDVQDRAQTSRASLQRGVQDRAQTSSTSLQRDVQDRAQTYLL